MEKQPVKKLKKYQIAELEAFAATIKKSRTKNKEEMFIAEYVDRMKALDWEGVRTEEEGNAELENCKARLEKLKKKYA